MKLNKDAIKSVINYIIEKQTFNFDDGQMEPIYLTSIVKDLSGNNADRKQEIACAIVRCINEGLIKSNYKHPAIWENATAADVTFHGFMWLKNN